jgi:hypothetical protein
MNTFEINQIFEGTYPPEAALWCNESRARMVELAPVTRQQERQELVREEVVIDEVLDESGEVLRPAEVIPAEYRTVVEDVTVRRFQIVAIPEPSEEELAEQALATAKAERAAAVAAITVTVDGMVFDGDETAQERMARTVTAATATGASMDDTTTWVLHDNTVAQVSIRQLATALRLAGEAQTALWTRPYEG